MIGTTARAAFRKSAMIKQKLSIILYRNMIYLDKTLLASRNSKLIRFHLKHIEAKPKIKVTGVKSSTK